MYNKGFKIKSYTYLYVLILFAIFSSVLRITDNGMTSFFRLFAPLIVGFCFIKRIKAYSKDFVFYSFMLLYSTFVSLLFFKHIEIEQLVFTTYVFFLYIIIKETKHRDKNFDNNFWLFIHWVSTFTILMAWIQHFVPYVLPHLVPPMKAGSMSVYFTNENELSAALSSVFIIYLYIILFTKKKKTILIIFNTISIPIIGYINDAKLSMMGIIVAAFLFLLYYMRKQGVLKRLRDNSFVKVVLFCFIVVVIILFVWNPQIRTRDYTMSIREMLFNWIFAIFEGQDTGGLSTYQERSSAIIYGIREYSNTYGFGIGIGNSVYMLTWPQYFLRYAKSMHNIIIQFFVELGFFAVVVYCYVIKKISYYFKSIHISEGYLLKAVFFVSIIFISSQSSVGFLSNYLELVVVIYIALMDTKCFLQTQKAISAYSDVKNNNNSKIVEL